MRAKQAILLTAVIFLISIAGQSNAEDKNLNSWITAEEAALPAMKSSDKARVGPNAADQPFPVSKESEAGPIIHIEKPDKDKAYHDLIDILIRFEKNPLGEPVNMESLRIIYLKMFGIDITDRIRPHIKETSIDAHGIKFPEGEHEFEIRIKDREQMESSEIVKIKVN